MWRCCWRFWSSRRVALFTRTAVVQITSNAAQYETQLGAIMSDVAEWPLIKWIELKQFQPGNAPNDARKSTTTTAPTPNPDENRTLTDDESPKVTNPLTNISQPAIQAFLLGVTNAVLDIVRQSVVVLVFLFFLLLSSVKRDRPIGGAWGEMEVRIRTYIVTMTTLSAVTGAWWAWCCRSLACKPRCCLGC